ncbi:disintegrin and metalloproteinase domain-containing protein 9 isoform X2 [Dunckerocampus dactyliophorus]|uniref:disintegrin and metalloproteinase domain-containing protein 9 isoform X2 n=1 Tax=Dunckerocampus dactyliophorus TaxID=161453 RepID=UPI002405CB19|nr:disintegrin and metalloproteinase domain-containing protein 9 isoform X2 [Dunckerocampus dactyliophorus]
MVTEHVAILFLLLFCTPGIDTTDITDGLSNYSIVQPQLLPNQKYDGDEHISYVLKVDNKPHILHLKRNRDFLHPDLFVADNRTATHPRHVHCYYHGEVEGYENSVVALSTCYGLRGVILFANESYGIEPLPHSATHEHLLYRLIDFQTGPVFCGVLHEATETQSHEPFEAVDYMSALLRFGNNQLLFASTVVAHEMGHNLGMNHDNTRCNCDGQPCIMAASASGSTSFSRCSAEDFEALILSGRGVCLANQPSLSDVVDTAQCGNGMLEEGEECDCGTPEECQNNCCVAATCQLSAGSACAQGECCNDCQLRVSGTPCRGVVNSCDLPEFCNGTSAFCPDDFYMMDGLPCENNAAYCYEGRCQTYDSQCKRLFAPDPATKAADTCFQHLNTKGNLFGNCGITSSGDYIKCAVADAMCGKVQCTNVDVNHPPPDAHVSIQVINGSTCVNADFNLGPDVLDPAYVNAGSPCAEGKTCLDFKCVDASALLPNLDCDAQQTCNGRGVCNDQGHCHCDDGWSPPNCNRAGTGGSIDSGPNKINFSLRNGLLIFFLAVVPLLVLLVLLLLFFFRRDTFNPCLKPTRRSRSSHAGNANGRSNGNIETHATTRIPRELPPQRLDNPPATSAPVTRYGELDYWNTSSASAHGQVPRQGPGVPRPITSRQSPK